MQAQPLVALAAPRQKDIHLLRAVAVPMGCRIVGEYTAGDQALRSIAGLSVDIVVADEDLGNMTGLDFARSLSQISDASILLLCTQPQPLSTQDLIGMDTVVLQKPLRRTAFVQSIQTMMHYRHKIHALQQQVKQLRSDIERRTISDKAKTMLINRMKMSESQAWQFLQKTSMDTGKPLEEIARLILERFKTGTI